MKMRLLTLSASALLLASTIAFAQEQSGVTMMPNQGMGQGMGMMGMMPPGMMGQQMGMMREGMMHRLALRMMFILMDTNGDGGVSLDEFQAAHARIFKAIDANGDGKITVEEVEGFFRGGAGPSGQ